MNDNLMRIELPIFETLPQRISRLGELSYNLWWSWQAEARRLFKSLDPVAWSRTRQNAVRMLREIPKDVFEKAASDPSFLCKYDSVMAAFDKYMGEPGWYMSAHGDRSEELIAYFCAEFAVHTSVPIYSGGLGLLAGDTCKEASDLGVPFVAVGALYPEGYFRQRIAADGNQEAFYELLDTSNAPLLQVKNDDGTRLLVDVPLDGRSVKVGLWRVQVGRVPIFLMDTDIEENEPWDRDMVARLYGGDNEVRLRQEIILGVGGVRVLRSLGYSPTVFHLNEGHAAFAALELIRECRETGLSFNECIAAVREKLVFTTHTPVEAGHDEFAFHLMEEHFRHFWEKNGLTREEILGLGSPPNAQRFSMTVLALNTARKANGVSAKHGEVSRQMWSFLYPGRPVEEVPITSITNGVHVPTWIGGTLGAALASHLDPDWLARHDEQPVWDRIEEVPDEAVWQAHRHAKVRLFRYMQERARQRWMVEGGAPAQTVALGSLMHADALTIGFARRFATYKRATLIFQDLDRIKRILLNPQRPVQLVFAGKAHPADEPGKFFLKQVYELAMNSEFAGRIAFIENYDKQVGHRLTQGVDVWMNNPEPPKEASGTSGQKASLNGVPNLSVLDGWWCEGYNGRNGWAITGENDLETANSIYHLLENVLVPLYYDQDECGVPHAWVKTMKEAIRSTTAPFSTRRMMKEYISRMYLER